MSKSIFLNSINEFMITRRFAKRTIQTYIYWIKRYIIFNKKQHPSKLGNKEVEQYLTFLSNEENVAPGTQTIALNSLVFLYSEFLKSPLSLALNFNKSQRNLKRFGNYITCKKCSENLLYNLNIMEDIIKTKKNKTMRMSINELQF